MDKEIKKEILKLDNNKCQAWGCGKILNLEIHHIIPLSQGGPSDPSNLITLCHNHHELITENRISEVAFLEKIKCRKNFRWGKSLEWHKNRENLRNKK